MTTGIPPDKQANYNSRRGAEAYKSDYETKLHRKVSDRLERRIFARFFERIGRCESVLDLPCGAGRLFSLLGEHSERVVEADWSRTMLELDRSDHDAAAAGYVRCSGLELPFADDSVDLVVSIRLSHHLDRHEDRERHLRELFRVADRAVIVTWFSATSMKNLLRRLRAPIDRKRPKNTLHTRHVRELAADSGYPDALCLPLSRFGSGHVFGLFTTAQKS